MENQAEVAFEDELIVLIFREVMTTGVWSLKCGYEHQWYLAM